MDLAQEIIANFKNKDNPKYKSTQVQKDIEVQFDLGNLLALDSNAINEEEFRSNAGECLQSVARDNAQLLINELWKLPAERVENVYVATLPSTTTRLPREKPIAPPKKATKWETFAKMKGIQKKKKSRMVYDEKLKEYRPRWGYQRANDETQEWCREVPDTANPFEDQFEKVEKAKKERIAKNEFQRLRNLARNMKGKVPGVTLMPVAKPEKQELSVLQEVAKKSTASLGKFTKALPKEKAAKNMGKKRKFETSINDLEQERKRAKKIIENIKSKNELIDKTRAANLLQAQEEKARSQKKREEEGPKGKNRRSKFGANHSKKGKSFGGDRGKGKSFGGDRGKGKGKGKGKPKLQSKGSGKKGKPQSSKGKRKSY